nr:MAG TPA: hypothetical protein [Caudoviricetes sp.]
MTTVFLIRKRSILWQKYVGYLLRNNNPTLTEVQLLRDKNQ